MLKDKLRLQLLRAVPPAHNLIKGRTARPGPGSPARILLIRPDHLGDLLFTTPAIKLLREELPQAEITLLVGPWSLEVASHIPNLDRIITCPFSWFDRKPKAGLIAPYSLLLTESRKLSELRFDMAINLRFDFWWGAILSYLAGIPSRVGYDLPECRPFLTHPIPYIAARHEALQNAGLVQAVSGSQRAPEGLEFETTEQEEELANRWLSSQGVEGPLVALHPGAGATIKLWPAENYGRLAQGLSKRYGASIVLTGSEQERGLLAQVSANMPETPRILAGASLGELAAVLRRCQFVIGADSGALHLAVAVKAPSLHLYGPVSPQTFGPWGDPSLHKVITTRYPCAPCNRLDFSEKELQAHRCMAAIRVEDVLEAAEALLKETSVAYRG